MKLLIHVLNYTYLASISCEAWTVGGLLISVHVKRKVFSSEVTSFCIFPFVQPQECEDANNLMMANKSCFAHTSLDYVYQVMLKIYQAVKTATLKVLHVTLALFGFNISWYLISNCL